MRRPKFGYKKLIAFAGVAASLWIAWRVFCACTNPVLIFCKDRTAQVFLDGSPVNFIGGAYSFEPFSSSYLFEVRRGGRIEQRRIFPYGTPDSPSIEVGRDNTIYNIESKPVE